MGMRQRCSFTANDGVLWDDDACSISQAIQKDRSVTCQEFMLATLDRIDRINARCNAIILLRDRQELLAEAKQADHELHQENSRGWLHGIPMAIKDLSNVKGIPTTMGGSRLFADSAPATHNDVYVDNLIQNGAIVIGKTNTPEGGLGSNTFNDRFGVTRNPFDLFKSAVATGMLAVADGTDNMGSLRNPAGWNNIYSIRPTAGLVPTGTGSARAISIAEKVMGHPASTPGAMARTPLDMAMVLQCMVNDLDAFDISNLIAERKSPSESFRIGWLSSWDGYLSMEDGVLDHCRQALDDWEKTSATTGERVVVFDVNETCSLFPIEELWESYNTVRFASTLEKYSADFNVQHLIDQRGQLIREELAWELTRGRKLQRLPYYEREMCTRYLTSGRKKSLRSSTLWCFLLRRCGLSL